MSIQKHNPDTGKLIKVVLNKLAYDAEKWITTKRKEGGGGGGRRFLIDTETGVILKGGPKRMQGKPLNRAFETKQQRKDRYKGTRQASQAEYKKTIETLKKRGVLHSTKAAGLLKQGASQKRLEHVKQLLKDDNKDRAKARKKKKEAAAK